MFSDQTYPPRLPVAQSMVPPPQGCTSPAQLGLKSIHPVVSLQARPLRAPGFSPERGVALTPQLSVVVLA